MVPERLEEAEWNFSELGNADEVRFAFFWEYSRESKTIIERINWLRSETPEFAGSVSELIVSEDLVFVKAVHKTDEQEEYSDSEMKEFLIHESKNKKRYQEFKKKRFFEQIEFLSRVDSPFPRTRYIDVREKDTRFTFTRIKDRLFSKPPVVVHELDQYGRAKEPDFSGHLAGGMLSIGTGYDHFAVSIPWNMSERKLLEELKGFFRKFRTPETKKMILASR